MRAWLVLVRVLSVRSALRAPLRSLLTLLGVALGVAMIVATQATNQAIFGAFDELSDRAAGKADLEITGDESGIDQRLVDELAARPDLAAHAAGRIEQTTLLLDDAGSAPLRVLVLGVDLFGDPRFLPFETRRGKDVIRDPIAFANDPTALLVSETLAARRGWSVGAPVLLRTARGVETFHVEAILRETGASAAYGGQIVALSLDAAQLVFARPDKLDRIDVELPKGAAPEASKRALQALVGDRAHVDRPRARAARLRRLTQAFTGGLEVAASVAVLIGAFLVFQAVGVAVVVRRRDIGVLRALGASRAAIAWSFVAEALLLGLVGGALGVVIGGGLARGVVAQFAPNVSRFFENVPTPTSHVGARLAIAGIALGALTAAVAALLPSLEAARTSPLDALRRDRGERDPARFPTRAVTLLALALAVAAAVAGARSVHGHAGEGLLAVVLAFAAGAAAAPLAIATLSRPLAAIAQRLFGVGARLGVDAVPRALGRSAQTVAALTLAAALGITLAAYTRSYEATCMQWVEEAIPADVIVAAGSPLLDHDVVPVAPRWREAIAATPGVASVNLVRSLSVPFRDVRIEVASLETETYLARVAESRYRRVVEGPFPIPVDALSKAPTALVSENLARREGLHPGDVLELPTPSGPRALRVVAIVLDYSNDQGWVLVDRKFAVADFGDERVEAMHVYAKPGVDPQALADAIRARVAALDGERGDGGLFVTTSATFKAEVREVIHQTFGISQAAEAVALTVALLGVLGTMLAAILDRGREIALLRAIGGLRRQVVAGAMAEATTLALIAAIVGALVAIPCAVLFIDVLAFAASGWRVELRFPWLDALRLAATMSIVAALAGAIATIGRVDRPAMRP